MTETDTPVNDETGTVALAPGEALSALRLELPLDALPENEVREGSPRAGAVTIDAGSGYSLGVWEMTEGAAIDVEVDECFIVLAGRATVTIEADDDADSTVLHLAVGSIGRLSAGMRTEWVVHEDLRKVYLEPLSA